MADAVTELGLSRPAATGREPRDRELLDRLGAVLAKATIDSRRLQSQAFLAEIDAFRRRLSEGDAGAPVAAFPETCDDYFTRARAYLLEREREYAGLIDVLRETVRRLAGESSDFHAELLATSTRMERLVDIDDLRELKARVARESTRLREATEEQKRHEEQTRSRLRRRIETLQASLSEAQEQAATDPLTGIPNRGRFNETIQRWIDDAAPAGETFAVLFSGATAGEAEARLTRVLLELASRPFSYEGPDGRRSVTFTVSAGVAESTPGDTVTGLVRRADEGLCQAKKRGRNRVVVQHRGRLASLFR